MKINCSDVDLPTSPPGALSFVSLLFSLVGFIGITGNLLVVWFIVGDRRMRRSATNLFIANVAVPDLLLMFANVPEQTQFILNRGWLLDEMTCRIERYLLTACLYVSILSLLAVCIERFIAIVHPLQVHMLCSRRRIVLAVCLIWPVSFSFAAPVLLYNRLVVVSGLSPMYRCALGLTPPYLLAFKVSESLVFYVVPVIVQCVLYGRICRKLFVSNTLRGMTVEAGQREPEVIRARKGVVKMLIASVLVYVVCYGPAQLPLWWKLISGRTFPGSWTFHASLMTLAMANSAINPLLYAAFSGKFRLKFRRMLCPGRVDQPEQPHTQLQMRTPIVQPSPYTHFDKFWSA